MIGRFTSSSFGVVLQGAGATAASAVAARFEHHLNGNGNGNGNGPGHVTVTVSVATGRGQNATTLPLGAYNVSGEYSMLHAAAAAGMIDLDRAMMEVLTSIRRAGADFILTYHAMRAAELLGH